MRTVLITGDNHWRSYRFHKIFFAQRELNDSYTAVSLRLTSVTPHYFLKRLVVLRYLKNKMRKIKKIGVIR